MRKYVILLLIASALVSALNVFADAPTISIFPEKVLQGEPVKIVIENISGPAAVRKVTFDGKSVGVFTYAGKPTALLGISLNKAPGRYKITVVFSDGGLLEKNMIVGKRERVSAPLGIPAKLGGNTIESQVKLVSSLAQENDVLASLRTFPKSLWVEKFLFPITNPIVSDPYGYSRQTGSYSITHRGTDFRADLGTPVVAMNRGIVRLTRTFRVYGKTIVIDHGQGLFTFYMHLSKIKVSEGELVKKSQFIGMSGNTGYAENPHLHVSVRVQNTSIDPMKFMQLFD